MRSLLLLSFLIPSTILTLAQEKKDSLSPYLFPEFKKGKVKMKNGSEANTLLNYYTITQEIIFEQQGNRLALAELPTIDTVIIEGRKFIPVDNKFYEVLTNTIIPLLARHSASLINAGIPTAYGGNSSFATSLSDISSAGRVYGLRLPDNYTTLPHTDYWLKKKFNYYEANNLKQIQRVFPSRADAIQDFIKVNNIDLKKQDDLVKLILFCQQ
ncbi:hypothetical protein OCK74_27145 [Chitinophagaceae bacterium LB-8]|uniref:Uncharacterized protein n=1 Tax=Paraflavisolibacter caeni TaxID=2982496 RepID=A0A9X2Y0Q1_9BACT|nr:hypothetical protein [Paraflavisolibacter caeni]MCU7552825.1 hypothetical protein [Paraflavisolibacter caeni]